MAVEIDGGRDGKNGDEDAFLAYSFGFLRGENILAIFLDLRGDGTNLYLNSSSVVPIALLLAFFAPEMKNPQPL